jgi:hypothetical protein
MRREGKLKDENKIGLIDDELIGQGLINLTQQVYGLLVVKHGHKRAGEIWARIGYPALVESGWVPKEANIARW